MQLFCLPGLDGTGQLFDDFLAALPGAVDAQVLAYPTDEPLDYAQLEARLAPRLPRTPFALLGESFGGPLALRLAARAGPALRAVVLVATFHRRPVGPTLAQLGFFLRAPFFSLPLPGPLIRRLLAGKDAPASLVSRFRASVAQVRGRVLAARARSALTVDASAAAKACAVPTLYLAGADDALMRAALPEELRALVPALEVETLPTPHLVLQRAPRESAALVADFLRRCG